MKGVRLTRANAACDADVSLSLSIRIAGLSPSNHSLVGVRCCRIAVIGVFGSFVDVELGVA